MIKPRFFVCILALVVHLETRAGNESAATLPRLSEHGSSVVLSDPLWRSFVETVLRELATPVEEDRLRALCMTEVGRLADATIAQAVDACIEKALDDLDPYAQYIPPRTYAAQERTGTGPYASLGFELRAIRNPEEPLVVVATIPRSPAERAGFRPGDILLSVDGVRLAGLNQAERLALLRGKAGTEAVVQLERDGSQKTIIGTREFIKVATARSAILDQRFLYLSINSFYEDITQSDVTAAVSRHLAALAKAEQPLLILDLRANSGGQLNEVARTTALFVAPATPLFVSLNRKGTEEYVSDLESITEPDDVRQVRNFLKRARTAVLVDGLTSSGAEALTQLLRLTRSAIVVGEPTSGNMIVRQRKRLNNVAAVVLTVGRLAVPNSKAAQPSAIPIDVPVKLGRGYEFGDTTRDVGLRAAMQALSATDSKP